MEEKFLKKSIVVTGMGCNSNCIFCLQETRKPAFFPREKILKKIVEERTRGATWLVITGGEASIHKDFLDFVRFAKGLGFERIQTVSNGRMFSSKKFATKAKVAGLTELTISFHGSTPEKHDALTRTPGSFKEATQAAINCRDLGLLLSFNTALSSLNVLDLGNIVKYIHADMGFRRFDYDIVGTSPNGRTWQHKLLPKHEDVKKGLKEAFDYAERNQIIVWVTRTPIQDFSRGYEYHKEPWEVITHDVISMWPMVWRDERICDPLKCEYCEGGPFCDHINVLRSRMKGAKLSYVTGSVDKAANASKFSENFLIDDPSQASAVEKQGMKPFIRPVFDGMNLGLKQAAEKLEAAKSAGLPCELEFRVNHKSLARLDDFKKFDKVFSPTNPYPYVKYSFHNSNIIMDTSGAMLNLEKGLKSARGEWMNVPLCIRKGREKEYWVNLDDFSGSEPRPREFVNRIAADLRVYPWDCDKCIMKPRCPGFFGDYVKLFGFDKVKAFSRPRGRQTR
ncbi:radical SAM protein [Candidatus Bathyarchaeota archaeon]|nr:radical SAM protein [Candidatus Bathyarchaeota archaeon]